MEAAIRLFVAYAAVTWILRGELERLLEQVVVAFRLLNKELRHATHKAGDNVLFGLAA